jgi:hypothetical protein
MAEHYTQKAIFDFARLYERTYKGLKWMHSIPNAGKRTEAEAIWMRDEGLTAGIADICLPYPINGYHGLYAEVKSHEGRLRQDQREFLAEMAKRGYLTDLWRTFDQAQVVLMRYVQGEISRKKTGCSLWT